MTRDGAPVIPGPLNKAYGGALPLRRMEQSGFAFERRICAMNNMTFGTAIAVVLAAASLPAAAGPLLSQSVVGDPAVVASAEIHHSWQGRSYCWYESGWKGPGWYRCGFAARRGLGWGGPAGWHGWSQEADV